jgi:hypothetical protein
MQVPHIVLPSSAVFFLEEMADALFQMQKLRQNYMNDRMKELTEHSQTEASIMRVFQFITLIFLPVTVVSVSAPRSSC